MPQKSLDHFIEDYVDGEPLTPQAVKSLIRKYINMNYVPTKQEKLDDYEKLLYTLGAAVHTNDATAIVTILGCIEKWRRVRLNPIPDYFEQQVLENETHYKLNNPYY